VSAPWWTFENLTIRGACTRHSDCEHAFHVVAGAEHFAAINNTITDFNAHFKINGSGGRFPDHGLIDGNTLSNSTVRDTGNPVTPIDLVAASHWTIRRNLITDFIKAGGDGVSYGAFAKGAGSANRFERNVVWCEHRLRAAPGQRVGLALGGGGTGKPFCRDGRCITEQDGGVIDSNLIASCSDDGIYLNSAARSTIRHNTLLDTGGISVRFPSSSADVEGNLVDGAIRSRNDGVVRPVDNRETPIALLYLGQHPVRRLFTAPETLDFTWSGAAPRRQAAAALPNDLCGAARPDNPHYGAVEDVAACLAPLGSR
jgi:parallel beta-helix repeat protein